MRQIKALLGMHLSLSFFFSQATLRDLSSPTRDRTHTLCIGSAEF